MDDVPGQAENRVQYSSYFINLSSHWELWGYKWKNDLSGGFVRNKKPTLEACNLKTKISNISFLSKKDCSEDS